MPASRHRKAYYPVLSLLLTASAFSACVAEETLLRDEWLTIFEDNFPLQVCSEQSYFRQCFDFDAQTCSAVATATTGACIEGLYDTIPDEVTREDAALYGEELARCVGVALENGLADSRLDAAGCGGEGS